MMNLSDTQTARAIAGQLLKIGAIKLSPDEPFTWASGWKSPIYCDNRLSLSFPSVRSQIKHALCSALQANYAHAEAIAGVATAGIPQGALVADSLGLPFVYVRAKPKGHGMENMIEGLVSPGQKIVVLEDLISTGGSSLKAVEALRESGFEVIGLVAIFSYGFPIAEEQFKSAGVPCTILSNYHVLLEEALDKGMLAQGQMEVLRAWRNDPGAWHG
jgi:orotate phosphoribosyltransferase